MTGQEFPSPGGLFAPLAPLLEQIPFAPDLAVRRFFVLGHATYEQLLQPFRGLTAKAVLYEVAADWLGRPLPEQLAEIDQRLAAGTLRQSRVLQPLPLLGLPGVKVEDKMATHYDDDWRFRPGRRERSV